MVFRLLPALVLVLFTSGPTAAHQLNVFAVVQGRVVEGEVYFRGRVPAKQAKVEALAPDGKKLAEAVTDDAGKFSFTPKFRCDYRLVAEAGEGHGAEYVLSADELPGDLPPLGLAAARGGTTGEAPPTSPAQPAAATTSAGATDQQLADLVAREVGRQIAPLRKELNDYEQQIRFRDILGGIGYIFGVMGLVFYFLGSARKKK
ncbi:MAG: hypothetical protein ACYC35_04120 [Pirellulales bacterium]